MTPELKAKELVEKYSPYMKGYRQSISDNKIHAESGLTVVRDQSKACAFICCNEIIAEIEPDELYQNYNERVQYWKDVKLEIEKL